jgi:DNA-binding winged helix-turn-helix (wHTH) protein/tetratricopeptide (TPR) repeat protein
VATLARVDDAIILAHEPRFRLGVLEVDPARRQIAWDGERRTLEPRVMQVLVALAQAQGEIVGRDDLIACCWEGRVVGDSSINRVISLLRGLATETGAFDIETVTKVGYRLTGKRLAAAPAAMEVSPQPHAARFTRRHALVGVGALAAAGTGILGWADAFSPTRREARALYEAGLEIQRRGGDGNARQATVYFERAVARDPAFADAWAALAHSRYQLMNSAHETALEQLGAGVRTAARRALKLDPGNRQAVLTLALLAPNFRNWIDIERQTRLALRRMPDEPMLHGRLGSIFADTGRWDDAVRRARWIVDREPLVPQNQLRLAGSLWHSGRPDAARPVLARALELWPVEPFVWLANFLFLSFTGQAKAALVMAERSAFGLDGTSPLPRRVGIRAAQALASRASRDADDAIALILDARRNGRIGSFVAIPYLATLGAIEAAYAQAYDYYLGRRDPVSGERQALSPMAHRQTSFLFTAATRPLRADPRFPRLTAAIGLDQYWAETRSRPDYRHARAAISRS